MLYKISTGFNRVIRMIHLLIIDLIFLCTILFSTIFNDLPSKSTFDPKVEFETMFEIKSEGENYILSRPNHIVTDKLQNIYISDLGSMMIHKFSSTGEYIDSFGRRGRGPGEFLDITLLHINGNGLFAFDQTNLAVSQFSIEGDLIKTFRMDNRIMLWPRSVFDYGDQDYLFVYKLPNQRHFQGKKSMYLFHIVGNDFSEELSSFGDYSELDYAENAYLDHVLQMNTGSAYYESLEGELYYIPKLYNGKLYKYDVNNNSIVQDIVINDEMNDGPSFSSVEALDRFNYPGISISSSGYTIKGVNERISDGLFKTKSGQLIHFYSELIKEKITEDSEYNYHYKLFVEWDFLGGNPKKQLVSKYLVRNPVQSIVQGNDSKDNFFFINYDEQGVPSIEVKKLKMKE